MPLLGKVGLLLFLITKKPAGGQSIPPGDKCHCWAAGVLPRKETEMGLLYIKTSINTPDGGVFKTDSAIKHPNRTVFFGSYTSPNGEVSTDDMLEIVPPQKALEVRGGDATKISIYSVIDLGWEEAKLNGDLIESPNYAYKPKTANNIPIRQFLPDEYYGDRGWYEDKAGDIVICKDLISAMKSGKYDYMSTQWVWDTQKYPVKLTDSRENTLIWFHNPDDNLWYAWEIGGAVVYKQVLDGKPKIVAKTPKHYCEFDMKELYKTQLDNVQKVLETMEASFSDLLYEDKGLYIAALNTLNAYISANSEIIPDGYDRFQLHQEVVKTMSERYCHARGEEMIVGFFAKGVAEELSLFSDYPEQVWDNLIRDNVNSEIIIGRGPKSLAINLYPKENFDLEKDQSFGWVDGYGSHVEYYDSKTRQYHRSSMSGRTVYVLHIPSHDEPIEPIQVK